MAKRIIENGPVLFRDFLQEALYSRNLGYYSSSREKIGKFSDFTTAPELSPVFGQAIATQCFSVLERLGGGEILEFGSGTGSMAVEILLFLEKEKSLPKSYYIIEISKNLRQRQFETVKKKIPHMLHIIQWVSNIPRDNFEGIIIANELLDAMPVHKFRFFSGKLQEAYVNFADNQFILNWGKPSDLLKDYVEKSRIHSDAQYESEINLFGIHWLSSVTKSLSKGLVLVIDYGFSNKDYYSYNRYLGNIVCYRRHKAYNNPLQYVGHQDITTHVNFTNLAKEGIRMGLSLGGYINQGSFLVNCGAIDALHASKKTTSALMKFKQLTLPENMGSIFKVVAFKKGLNARLSGFTLM